VSALGSLASVERFGCAAASAGRVQTGRHTRPNIVLILADDLGYSDIGCFGAEIDTPNLDRLAHHGVRFTQMYSVARCCPSRASLLTGLYPHQTGIGHMTMDLGKPAYRGDLNRQCVTIAEVLRSAGYRTFLSGKWHVTPVGKMEAKDNFPLQRGFDRFFGTIRGAGSYYHPLTLMRDNNPIRPEGDFFYTDAITENAVRYLNEAARDDGPFFLYVAYTAPHWPLHAFPEDVAKYRDVYRRGWDRIRAERHRRMIDLGLIDAQCPLTPRDPKAPPWEEAPDKEWEAERMAVYAAQVDHMDRGIGAIVDALKQQGALDNTLLFFLSDNGGCAEDIPLGLELDFLPEATRDGRPIRVGNAPSIVPGGEDTFASYGLAWANVSDAPFALYKHWVHEGGIASPTIVHWPEVVRGGRISHEVAHIIDLMATCVDAAGADYPSLYDGRDVLPLEGQSLLPVLERGIRQGHGHLCWEHEGNRAVRKGKWKLVAWFDRDWELYDMVADRTETRDLAAEQPDIVRELAGLYAQWAERCGVQPWEDLLAAFGMDREVWKHQHTGR